MTNGTKPGRWGLRVLAMVLLLGLFPAINFLVDPFGVFGDPLFHWYGYNETNNPRVAKVAWLEEHKEDFDSYIIGESVAPGVPVMIPQNRPEIRLVLKSGNFGQEDFFLRALEITSGQDPSFAAQGL